MGALPDLAGAVTLLENLAVVGARRLPLGRALEHFTRSPPASYLMPAAGKAKICRIRFRA